MIAQVGQELIFDFAFVSSKVGATGLTVTVDVYRGNTEIVSAAAATEIGDGIYTYTLAAGSVTLPGHYRAIAKTSDGSVDQQHQFALHIVYSWAAYFDAAISSRLAASSYTTPPTVVQIRQEMDSNSADLDTALANLSTLLARLTSTRAGYLDNLSAGVPTTAQIVAAIDASSADLDAIQATLTAINGYVDDLETRLTATRAAKLDNLDATISSRSSHSAADVVTAMDSTSSDLNSIITALGGITGLQTDVTTLLARLTNARALLLDNLSRLDVAVSTRNALAPDNAGIAKLTGMTESSGGHDRFKANALEEAPTGSGGGSDTTGAIVREMLVSPPGIHIHDALVLVRGDDYSDTRALVFTMAGDELWPDLTGATIMFTARLNGGATISHAGEVVEATGAAKQVKVELTNADTANVGEGAWDIQATDGSVITTLRRGRITITNDVTT